MRAFRKHSLALAGVTLTFGLAIHASTAVAASTFLLQFGEHKTEEEARNQWENLRAANPEILSKMKFNLSEVGEADDKRYRSQAAGPESRSDAQDTCAKLASKNVDCLVVETSMYEPEKEPELKVSEATPAPLPVPPAPPAEEPGLEPVQEFSMNAEAAPAADEQAPAPIVDLSAPPPEPETAAPVEPTVTKSKSFKETLMPWLSSEKEVPAAEDKPVVEAKAEPVKEAPKPAAAPAPEPEPVAAPAVEPAQFEPAEQVAAEAAPAPSQSDTSFLSKVGNSFDSLVKSGKPVPERAPKNLADSTSGAKAQPVEVSTAPQIQPETAIDPNVQGEVEVAEAVRVPLSFGNGIPVPTSKPVGYGGFPSQPPAGRSTWVQIGNFANKEAAMGYWRELGYKQPEATRLLRVRIISPWQNRRSSSGHASLRLGPIASQDDMNTICGMAAEQKLNCTSVNEVGTTGAMASGARTRTTAWDQYNQVAASRRSYGNGSPSRGMFWLQLGAFDGVVEAQERWNQLQTTHGDLLGRMQPQISYPTLGSAAKQVYHLRTGPYMASGAASAVCDQLKARHLGCVVVQSR